MIDSWALSTHHLWTCRRRCTSWACSTDSGCGWSVGCCTAGSWCRVGTGSSAGCCVWRNPVDHTSRQSRRTHYEEACSRHTHTPWSTVPYSVWGARQTGGRRARLTHSAAVALAKVRVPSPLRTAQNVAQFLYLPRYCYRSLALLTTRFR